MLQVNATDADQGNAVNTSLRYSLASDGSPVVVTIDADTGVVVTRRPLDAEEATE